MAETVTLQIPEALYRGLAIAILYNSLILEKILENCSNTTTTQENHHQLRLFSALC